MSDDKIPLTGSNHLLNFHALSGKDFERLCCWLVEDEGFTDVEHLGDAGGESARDILARKDGKVWAFQCKNVQRFQPQDARKELDALFSLSGEELPEVYEFLVTCPVSARTRNESRKRCEKNEIECRFSDRTSLGRRVKFQSRVLAEFFQLAGPPKKPEKPTLDPNTPERPEEVGPAARLNARYRFVPFFEEVRRDELATLDAWCESETGASVRLFTGPGGSGKTRLLIEWTKRLRKRGWDAGFLPQNVGAESLTEFANAEKPTLVVIDYAETKSDLLELLVALCSRPDTGTRIRVMLLAREAFDWWRSLLEQPGTVRDLLERYEPRSLAPIKVEGDLRRRIFDEATNAFSVALGKNMPSVEPQLGAPRFARVLYLHMAALAAVESLDIRSGTLLESLVGHEISFWARRFQSEHENLSDDERARFTREACRTVAALTLRGGVSDYETAESLNKRVGGPKDEYFLELLEKLYPGRSEDDAHVAYLGGLEPDLLGEHIVGRVLLDGKTRNDFPDQVFEDAEDQALLTGFLVLGRLFEHEGRDAVAVRTIAQLLESDVPRRAIPAFVAALALGVETATAPVGRVLAQALERMGTLDLASYIQPRLPNRTVSLQEVGAWATTRCLDAIDKDSHDEETLHKRGRLANSLSQIFSDLEKREDALEAAREAAEISRKLSEARPAFLPALATCLSNLGLRLGELGRQEDALEPTCEAVETYRKIVAAHPEFLPHFAQCLSNLGVSLGNLGRQEDALKVAREATVIFRKLPAARLEESLPDLAATLSNIPSWLMQLERREEAHEAILEAIEIRRTLSLIHPDAFLPDLAKTLSNLGLILNALGRQEDALKAACEAIEVYRKLPDVFLAGLANSLNVGRICLNSLGRYEDALMAIRESIEIHVPLVERFPRAFIRIFREAMVDLIQSLQLSGIKPEEDEQVLRCAELLESLGPIDPECEDGEGPSH